MPEQKEKVRNLIGCNMSFRRSVLDRIGGFRSGIGRIGALSVGCEETELCVRLHQHFTQGALIYDFDIRVEHHVPASHSTLRYYLRRCYAEGTSKALISTFVGTSASLKSERVYTFRTLPRGAWQGLSDFIHGDLSGQGRVFAIGAGLAATGAGYMFGSLRHTLSSGRRREFTKPELLA